ncbi:hypothetical protein I5Q34_01160 [Streptomyces sp. AV19]|uniref:hypothetical protein n=1 Tax=Streptomyces sp. AV19 TaxID=2793068 RepID=UPI0018FF0B8A|nr:hypothetical protein [Streptomyces sp. AV19]MBH1932913.1 hypothetical protein [Streptomyces sp. AV19]MDG4531591.1 hypothetical protein [Streptomyces sp. AV19]
MNTPYPTAFSERRRAVEWLASQSNDPTRVRREWAQCLPALVPAAGPRFDAVRLPAAVVHQAAGARDRDRVEAVFTSHGITAAVIVDQPRRTYYVLVPPGTHRTWALPGIECLTPTCRMPLPSPHHAEPPGSHWLLSPPTGPEDLCAPDDIRQFVTATQPES